MDKNRYVPLRIWVAVSIGLPILGGVVRVAWGFASPMSADAWAMNILFMIGCLGVYAFVISVLIRPSLATLRSLPLRVLGSVTLTVAYAGAIIHFIRFAPSVWTAMNVTVVTLLMITATNALLLAFWIFWSVLKPEKGTASATGRLAQSSPGEKEPA